MKSKYNCDQCLSCIQCYEGRDDGPIVTCCICFDSYHYKCHVPQLQKSEVNHREWYCAKCSDDDGHIYNPHNKRSKSSFSDSHSSTVCESMSVAGCANMSAQKQPEKESLLTEENVKRLNGANIILEKGRSMGVYL